jgi:hypothetical protein
MYLNLLQWKQSGALDMNSSSGSGGLDLMSLYADVKLLFNHPVRLVSLSKCLVWYGCLKQMS